MTILEARAVRLRLPAARTSKPTSGSCGFVFAIVSLTWFTRTVGREELVFRRGRNYETKPRSVVFSAQVSRRRSRINRLDCPHWFSRSRAPQTKSGAGPSPIQGRHHEDGLNPTWWLNYQTKPTSLLFSVNVDFSMEASGAKIEVGTASRLTILWPPRALA